MFHKRYENEDNELFTWKEFANICVTKCVEISTFLPQYGHALSLIIERRIIQLDMLVTSKKRKLTLQRDEGALIWIASEDRFFLDKKAQIFKIIYILYTL